MTGTIGFPRFPADTTLTVDTCNGHEQWTAQEWNEYVSDCERTCELCAVRIVRIHHNTTRSEA